ncbi:hypothetical protein MP638_000816 [Amoeboaphelidium occidentale]|nr:hypothetical protein MP638_000816 [Amoeboaphelidium occidentale]
MAMVEYQDDLFGSDCADKNFIVLKSFLLHGPVPTHAEPRGILTKRSLRAFDGLQNDIMSTSVETSSGSRVSYRDICSVDKVSCWYWSAVGSSLSESDLTEDLVYDRLSQKRIIKLDTHPFKTVTRDALLDRPYYEDSELVGAASLAFTVMFNISMESGNASRVSRVIEEWTNGISKIQSLSYLPETQIKQNKKLYKNIRNSRVSLWVATLSRGVFAVKELIEHSEKIDVVVILVGYFLMGYIVWSIFKNMRAIGSRFSLAATTLGTGLLALCCSLIICISLGVPVSLIQLCEALPFIVIAIGFDKQYSLAKAILAAKDPADLDPSKSRAPSTIPISVRRKVMLGVDAVAANIMKHYLFEIFVLSVGATSGLYGLSEICLVTAITLAIDWLFMFTVFVSMLTLKMELRRLREESGDFKLPALSSLNYAPLNSDITYAKLLLTVGMFLAYNSHRVSNRAAWKSYLPFSSVASDVPFDYENTVPPFINSTAYSIIRNPQDFITVDSPFSFYVSGYASNQVGDHVKIIVDKLSSLFGNSSSSLNFVYGSLLLSFILNIYLLRSQSRRSETNDQISTLSKDVSTETIKESFKDTKLMESMKTIEERMNLVKKSEASTLSDEEFLDLLKSGKVPSYAIEKHMGSTARSVMLRRMLMADIIKSKNAECYLDFQENINGESSIPYSNYDYTKVMGVCCENVIGFTPLPLGLAGPYLINGKEYYIPMATTEGCLVASTSRGCKAISLSGGAVSVCLADGMTRAPVLEFSSVLEASKFKFWAESKEGFAEIKAYFESTSRFAKLIHVKATLAGNLVFLRYKTTTGDAMGMNMISKGVEKSFEIITEHFPSTRVVSISGNYCTDKKPAAINWIEGRGKSVVAECVVKGSVVESVLKTSVKALVELNISKNLIGSAMAGSVGGFNAHAANILTAMYLACGQDPAQNVESSNCITIMKAVNNDQDLYLSCTMPSIEVGTVGGGTNLSAQKACLKILGCAGAHPSEPGQNAQQLAKIICAAVMAGELSLCSALAAGHLVKSHMQHNRAKPGTVEVKSEVIGRCLR